MRKAVQRVVVTLGAVAVMLGMTIGPAAAATSNLTVTWDGNNTDPLGVTPSTLTINNGDSVALFFSSTDANARLAVYAGGTCFTTTPIDVTNNTTATLTPTQTTTYGIVGAGNTTGFFSQCFNLIVTVSSTAPPPDVPEVPYAAWLVVVSGALFGGGFFLLRRRAARTAGTAA